MLRSMVAAKPDDPFPAYGLAMELTKTGALEEARSTFDALIEAHPGYVPTYLMFGNLLVRMGDKTAALGTYDAGIAAATQAGDDHSRGELEQAKAELAGDDT
ncbi:MAG: hypothetical protein AAGA54_06210 [Myxococcota bacterium]